MVKFLRRIFGIGPAVDYRSLHEGGAIIIDVRTSSEYRGGHINDAVNIPLDNLTNELSRLKKDKPIITCCASGMRSASAKGILKSKGFTQVYNGGSWVSLERKIN